MYTCQQIVYQFGKRHKPPQFITVHVLCEETLVVSQGGVSNFPKARRVDIQYRAEPLIILASLHLTNTLPVCALD